MVLDIPGPQPEDDSTGGAAKMPGGPPRSRRRCGAAPWQILAEWVHGHGAKVVAAIIGAGDEDTVADATAALGKILKVKTPPWTSGSRGFSGRRESRGESRREGVDEEARG